MSKIVLDCSYGESGGQIIRNSVALACLLRKNLMLQNIRKKRKIPGLRAQHKTGLEMICEYGNITIKGNEIGSEEITVESENTEVIWNNSNIIADCNTAGSCTLMAQSIVPCILFGNGGQISLIGGTDVNFSPPLDYFKHIFKMMLEKKIKGLPEWSISIPKRGVVPKGGGEINIKASQRDKGVKAKGFSIDHRGKLLKISVFLFASGGEQESRNFFKNISQDILNGIKKLNNRPYDITQVDIEFFEDYNNYGGTVSVVIRVEFENTIFGFSQLISKKPEKCDTYKISKTILKEMDTTLLSESCIDEHMQDQLIIFMGLCEGKSTIHCGELSLHTQSAIHYVQLLTGAEFKITKLERKTIIECNGIGL